VNLGIAIKKTGQLWHYQADQVARAKTARALQGAARLLQPAIKARAPRASGTLASGVQIVTSRSGLSVRVVAQTPGSGLSYGIPVESGASQTKVAMEGLVKWAELKLGKSGLEARQTAYAIARWKERKGTTPKTNWFFGPFDRLTATINSAFLGPVGAAIVAELDR
jgi:hypothetical protein